MLKVELLAKHHDRKAFNCDNEILNKYLQTMANQQSKKGLSKTYVLIDDDLPNQILGFYSLNAFALDSGFHIDGLPEHMKIPSILLGRLAIDNRERGKGLTKELLAHFFQLVIRIAKEIGIALVLVDLKGLHLVPFYERYGFKQLSQNGLTMYLKTSDLQ